MRFVIIGAGAIGGVIGGRLHASGADVMLVARGPHGKKIRSDGLVLASPEGRQVLEIPTVAHPGDVPWAADDVAILAVKGQDTPTALRALVGSAGPDTPVVCAQNGLDNERQALRLFASVQAMCVMLPAEYLNPGVVAAYSSPVPGILHLGRYPHGLDDTSEVVAGALRAAGFRSEARPDALRLKARKLIMNLANAVDALCGRAHGVGDVIRDALAEGEAALAAAGIDAATPDEDAALRSDHLTIDDVEGEGPRHGGSTWQSLARGAGSVEADQLNGEVVLLGRLHDVPTPVNEALRRLIWRAAREGWPPESINPETLAFGLETDVDLITPHSG